MDKIFGIDLGTTYSCIAYVDESGKPVVVPNEDNERTTPSVVAFEGEASVIVGNYAKNMLTTDPEKVVSFIKRDMGNPYYVKKCNGIEYKPEEISARILQKLVKDASDKLGFEIKDVVITCPAYFGENEKLATKKAGEIAGLNVKSIIEEPVAAALAYGIDHTQNQTVLVYDLGGGTFDVTMIKVKPQEIQVIVKGGDHQLGGKDWDNSLMGFFAEKFKGETGVEDDILSNPEILGDLQIKAEKVKKTLSVRDNAKEKIVYGTDTSNIDIIREKFDELTKDLAERTIMLTNLMLDDAKKEGVSSFDKILMVGGSTKMPQIKEILEKNFPNISIEAFDQDESVAKGAAIYGQQLAIGEELIRIISEKTGKNKDDVKSGNYTEKEKVEAQQQLADENGLKIGTVQKAETKIINVASKSFGVEVIENNRVVISNIILIHTVLPAKCTKKYGTLEDNMQNIRIAVYENNIKEDTVATSDSKEIGQGIIEGLPANLPANSPVQVTFEIDREGLINVTAVELTGNNELNFRIETNSVISGEELEAAKARSNAIKLS
ncbi:MAG: Hsp70 family protein [Tannerellaceae bacterium]|jgi:molecular chaperone DnaK (HSP70)|nr:Hsp70 family protein [Tannerellaceae bacterium]